MPKFHENFLLSRLKLRQLRLLTAIADEGTVLKGSQALNMLSDLAAEFPAIEETFREASSRIGIDLWALVQDGPEEMLNRTENTQPALLAADDQNLISEVMVKLA